MTTTPENEARRAVELKHYRVLAVGGQERADFLQGQLTQDVGRVDETHSALAGWATAKGRLLAVGQLIATPDALLWPLPADIAAGVARRLGMFLLRTKADIGITDHAVFGLCGLAPGESVTIGGLELGTGPGATAIGAACAVARVIGDATRAWLCGPPDTIRSWCDDAGFVAADENEWHLLDIRAGLPTIVAATSEAFIPQMLNLDLLDGISFTKGCYVGQEIVARTQNLGRIKRRMYRFRFAGASMPGPGATIFGPESATGKVVNSTAFNDTAELTAVIAIEHSSETWFVDESRTMRLEPLRLPYSITAG